MLVGRTCMDGIQKYVKDLNIHDFQVNGINDIQLLKYETGGFYTWHIDHAGEIIPRTMSCILFLNDDYKGGELIFRDPNGENEMAIKPKSSRLIIWPSSFMYPHTVKPVTEGTRYSVVAWAV
jgi:predicted 2-oxoglutarate/Fe(II)-dependent dioxygenase YbiX